MPSKSSLPTPETPAVSNTTDTKGSTNTMVGTVPSVHSRSEIRMLSREQLNGQTIQSVYKDGYTTLTVKSIFNGNESLTDLFYQILQQKFTSYEEAVVQYKGNQSDYVVPQDLEGGTTLC